MLLFQSKKALIALCFLSASNNSVGMEQQGQPNGSYEQLGGSASYPNLSSLTRQSSFGDSLVVTVEGKGEVRMNQSMPVETKKTKKRPSRCCRITKWVTGLCVLGLATYGGVTLSKEGLVVYNECMRAKNSLEVVNDKLSQCLVDTQVVQSDALAALAEAEKAIAACAKCKP